MRDKRGVATHLPANGSRCRHSALREKKNKKRFTKRHRRRRRCEHGNCENFIQKNTCRAISVLVNLKRDTASSANCVAATLAEEEVEKKRKMKWKRLFFLL